MKAMDAKIHSMQAYRSAPWRSQMKWAGRILLVFVIILMITGLHLSISAQTAAAGIKVQDLEVEKGRLTREIATLRTQLAFLTSATEMQKRAVQMGFTFTEREKVVYVVVPGYFESQAEKMAALSGIDAIPQPLIKPSYTQSLWDWLQANTVSLRSNQAGESS